ncbi:MAG: hypothetical protein PHX83_11990 [Acidobacteriia bacterium]|nr:hypothetical protein [Terriglobia bacterium]
MPTNAMLKDYLEAQREAVKVLTLLTDRLENNTKAVEELRKGLSNGIMGRLCKKVEGIYVAIVALLVPVVWILIDILKDK